MNILFDLDGTLTDPYPGITNCIVYALERIGREAPRREALRWCIGPPLMDSFERLLGADANGLAQEALAFYRERFASVGLYENAVFDGVPAVLETLGNSGHALYVATAKPQVFARRIIAHFELERYFRAVYGSELDGTRSDKTDLIAHILQREGIAVSKTVMVGDRKHDMIGASKNGMPGYGVLWGYGSKGELKTAGAKACVTTPGELPPLFCGVG